MIAEVIPVHFPEPGSSRFSPAIFLMAFRRKKIFGLKLSLWVWVQYIRIRFFGFIANPVSYLPVSLAGEEPWYPGR